MYFMIRQHIFSMNNKLIKLTNHKMHTSDNQFNTFSQNLLSTRKFVFINIFLFYSYLSEFIHHRPVVVDVKVTLDG